MANTAARTKKIDTYASDIEFQSVRRAMLDERIGLDEGAARLFSFGYNMDRAGASDVSDEYYRQTIELLEFLTRRDYSESMIIEFARTAQRHGMMLIGLGRIAHARAAFRRSVELFDSILSRGVSAPAIEELARSLSWLASSQCLSKDFPLAEQSYLRAAALWRSLAKFAANAAKTLEYQRFLRLAHLGLAECSKNVRTQPAFSALQ